MTGNVAIVTLYSDFSRDGKGFLLSYVADTNSSAPNVAFSTNIILSATPDANLTYPADNSNYQNYELSTFVYSPDYSYNSSSILQADYFLNSLGNGGCDCCDFVAVYRFVTVTDEGRGWSYMDR
jgi:hypothetical protein